MQTFHLTSNISELEDYLHQQKWLDANERIREVEIPGAGNMNFTLRYRTEHYSRIIKQSRSYVEKYPQVPAPSDRALREAEFYNLVQTDATIQSVTPNLLGVDKEAHILLMEDLGQGQDYTSLYQKGENLQTTEWIQLIDFLIELHQNFTITTTSYGITNREMRQLNHEHIFRYPFIEENGLDLDQITAGLADIASVYRKDKVLVSKIEHLGEIYLSDGDVLLHGDFFPGSWFKTPKGIYIIDPEFCYFGDPSFEMGVFIAHLYFSEHSEDMITQALRRYGQQIKINEDRCYAFAGVEIMRRLLGLAQLPLVMTLEEKSVLLEKAHLFINTYEI